MGGRTGEAGAMGGRQGCWGVIPSLFVSEAAATAFGWIGRPKEDGGWRGGESTSRHRVYETPALPTELPRRLRTRTLWSAPYVGKGKAWFGEKDSNLH